MPFKNLERDASELVAVAAIYDKVFIMCRRGLDSKDLTDKLIKGNLQNCVNVEGGISEWSKKVDPTIPYY